MDLSILGLGGVEALLLPGCVIGAVELVKALFAKNWQTAVIIAVAAVIGGAVSPLLEIDLILGVVSGLAASGAVTFAQNLGGTNHSSDTK